MSECADCGSPDTVVCADCLARLVSQRGVVVEERTRDELEAVVALRGAQLLMVGSELAGDPKMDHADRSDPRWTPTLQEAWAARQKHKEDAAQIVALMHERDRLQAILADLAEADRERRET